jgi:hypothetical protein
MPEWPREITRELDEFYGQRGRQTVMLNVPEGYGMKLYDTQQAVRRMSVHPRIHDPVLRVLQRTLEHYGAEEIDRLRLNRYFGCLFVRPMRGGNRWSIHSWAAALDFDATNNPLRMGRDRAPMAGPDYVKWWELWYDEGAIGLGIERNYDWQHVQFARLV